MELVAEGDVGRGWTMLFQCRQKPASKYSKAVRLWKLEVASVVSSDRQGSDFAGHVSCSR